MNDNDEDPIGDWNDEILTSPSSFKIIKSLASATVTKLTELGGRRGELPVGSFGYSEQPSVPNDHNNREDNNNFANGYDAHLSVGSDAVASTDPLDQPLLVAGSDGQTGNWMVQAVGKILSDFIWIWEFIKENQTAAIFCLSLSVVVGVVCVLIGLLCARRSKCCRTAGRSSDYADGDPDSPDGRKTRKQRTKGVKNDRGGGKKGVFRINSVPPLRTEKQNLLSAMAPSPVGEEEENGGGVGVGRNGDLKRNITTAALSNNKGKNGGEPVIGTRLSEANNSSPQMIRFQQLGTLKRDLPPLGSSFPPPASETDLQQQRQREEAIALATRAMVGRQGGPPIETTHRTSNPQPPTTMILNSPQQAAGWPSPPGVDVVAVVAAGGRGSGGGGGSVSHSPVPKARTSLTPQLLGRKQPNDGNNNIDPLAMGGVRGQSDRGQSDQQKQGSSGRSSAESSDPTDFLFRPTSGPFSPSLYPPQQPFSSAAYFDLGDPNYGGGNFLLRDQQRSSGLVAQQQQEQALRDSVFTGGNDSYNFSPYLNKALIYGLPPQNSNRSVVAGNTLSKQQQQQQEALAIAAGIRSSGFKDPTKTRIRNSDRFHLPGTESPPVVPAPASSPWPVGNSEMGKMWQGGAV